MSWSGYTLRRYRPLVDTMAAVPARTAGLWGQGAINFWVCPATGNFSDKARGRRRKSYRLSTTMPALGSALGTSQLYVFTRTRFLVIPVPSISLACSNRSLSKSKRTCFLRIQPRRRSAQHLPDGSLYSVSLYPIFVRAAMVDRESAILLCLPWFSRGRENHPRSVMDGKAANRLIHIARPYCKITDS
jgi:hypothetical protein